MVTRVEKNSVSERVGIVPGDVILKVGNERMRNKSHVREVLNQARNVTVIIDRRGILMQLYLGL